MAEYSIIQYVVENPYNGKEELHKIVYNPKLLNNYKLFDYFTVESMGWLKFIEDDAKYLIIMTLITMINNGKLMVLQFGKN